MKLNLHQKECFDLPGTDIECRDRLKTPCFGRFLFNVVMETNLINADESSFNRR